MAINWKQGKEVIDLAKKKNLFFGEVSVYFKFEENDNSAKLFGAKTILAYGRGCKTKIPRMFANPSGAYVSA